MKSTKVLLSALLVISFAASADFQGFKATQKFCHVEIRSGNTLDPSQSKFIWKGSLEKDQVYPAQDVNGFARRETNPGDCNAPMSNQWTSCQWDVCELR